MNDFLIHESAHTTIEQAYGYRIAGYLIVQPKAACTRISELDPAQAVDLMKCLTLAETLAERVAGAETVYLLKFAESNPQIHFHVFPRTPDIGSAYSAAMGDEKPYSGARLMDWIWLNHESLGHTDEQIRAFVTDSRAFVSEGA